MSEFRGWIGVDLDGTLAEYHGWQGIEHIGEPVPAMLDRVKQWLAEGRDVRIFTARVSSMRSNHGTAREFVEAWLIRHLDRVLPVTCEKDLDMLELWDDRCVTVERNTGKVLTT